MVAMAAQWFRARVAEKQMLASKFLWLHLELVQPDRIEFNAGQYLMMRVPGMQGLKQYSIVSAPSMNHGVELLVDIGPQGLGSKYLQGLKPGDEVEFMGPAGRFVITEGTEKKLIFVATGSGISSIKGMIEDLLVDKQDKRPMWLSWGLRYPEDVFWFSEFAELAEEYANFSFDPVLSRPNDGWKFCQGHVTECVLKHHSDFSGAGVYLCGNKGMIEEMKKILLERRVAEDRIHHEEYY
jgi:phenol/toluene 2-monooxygenase (NADH) P5/A5